MLKRQHNPPLRAVLFRNFEFGDHSDAKLGNFRIVRIQIEQENFEIFDGRDYADVYGSSKIK